MKTKEKQDPFLADKDPGAETRARILLASGILLGLGIVACIFANILPEDTYSNGWFLVSGPSTAAKTLSRIGEILVGIGGAILLPGLSLAAWQTSRFRVSIARERQMKINPAIFVGSLKEWANWWLVCFWIGIIFGVLAAGYLILNLDTDITFVSDDFGSIDLTQTLFGSQVLFIILCWLLHTIMKKQVEEAEAVGFVNQMRNVAGTKGLDSIAQTILGDLIAIPGKEYMMAKHEVTQAQWSAVMGTSPADFKGPNNPIENVSWFDCQKFLELLNSAVIVTESGLTLRLPTVEEWEFACRAGTSEDYCRLLDGTEITEKTIDRVAWCAENSQKKTHPVGQKEPNAFGLYDMIGNVWEWTQTSIGNGMAKCGGSSLTPARFSTANTHDPYYPRTRFNSLGFRICAEKSVQVPRESPPCSD